MKKIIILALCMTMLLAGCGNKNETNADQSKAEEPTEKQITTESAEETSGEKEQAHSTEYYYQISQTDVMAGIKDMVKLTESESAGAPKLNNENIIGFDSWSGTASSDDGKDYPISLSMVKFESSDEEEDQTVALDIVKEFVAGTELSEHHQAVSGISGPYVIIVTGPYEKSVELLNKMMMCVSLNPELADTEAYFELMSKPLELPVVEQN